ncbi:hypothetical protein [Pseudogemmobacter bohemicus]|uniref:hypothetical protein n=1 Tax=Pseudogemmobacter bohemicus TaxID=2250708 RepID=UPI000DD4092F|nr:hypothetical protein [Pseudogemmobacter bohemicus]
MRRPSIFALIAIASTAALSFATLPAPAQSRGGNNCPPDQAQCIDKGGKAPGGRQGAGPKTPTPGKGQGQQAGRQPGAGQGHNKAKTAHASPKKGDSAREGSPFQRAPNSRFGVPPRGQEYRVVGDHLVLADSQSMRVVAVIGLLSSLLN